MYQSPYMIAIQLHSVLKSSFPIISPCLIVTIIIIYMSKNNLHTYLYVSANTMLHEKACPHSRNTNIPHTFVIQLHLRFIVSKISLNSSLSHND